MLERPLKIDKLNVCWDIPTEFTKLRKVRTSFLNLQALGMLEIVPLKLTNFRNFGTSLLNSLTSGMLEQPSSIYKLLKFWGNIIQAVPTILVKMKASLQGTYEEVYSSATLSYKGLLWNNNNDIKINKSLAYSNWREALNQTPVYIPNK
ncbi:hypothetical protein ACF0H5_017190 [Mactra antiquata]